MQLMLTNLAYLFGWPADLTLVNLKKVQITWVSMFHPTYVPWIWGLVFH